MEILSNFVEFVLNNKLISGLTAGAGGFVVLFGKKILFWIIRQLIIRTIKKENIVSLCEILDQKVDQLQKLDKPTGKLMRTYLKDFADILKSKVTEEDGIN